MRVLLRRAPVAIVVAAALVVAGPGTAAIAELPVRPTESHIDPSLADVAVSSPEHDRLLEVYDTARTGREETQAAVDRLQADERAQKVTIREIEASVDVARRRVGRARTSLRATAVSAYIGIEATTAAELSDVLAGGDVHAGESRITVAEIIGQDRVDGVTAARRRLGVWTRRLAAAEAELASIRGALVEVEAERDRYLETELTSAPDLEDARAVAEVDGHDDLSLVALDAYVAAAKATAETDPACGLHWSLLAGIGRIETGHGTFGGTELGPDGVTQDRIRGIALTGGGGTAHIADTDGGQLDGDAVYDRAVGPMQFIPSTWVRWAQDGDGDDEADPHNIYDAAMSAAAYLCASGPGLDTDGGRARAVLSYNRSQAYVADVSAQADGYRSILS